MSSRLHPYNSWLEYGLGPLPYLRRSRMLQSSYINRCLADHIHITVGWIRIRRRIKGGSRLALSQGLSKLYIITSWGDWYTYIQSAVQQYSSAPTATWRWFDCCPKAFWQELRGCCMRLVVTLRGDYTQFPLACNTLGLVTLDAATLEAIQLLFNSYLKNWRLVSKATVCYPHF